MKRILFVDDEPMVLKGLKRMLRPMRSEWEMEFVSNGKDALDILEKSEFDVVVTDMRMPEMTGAQLLCIIRDKYPHIVRLVLSGEADTEKIVQTVDPVHQYLSKPCDPDKLKDTVSRAFALRDLLAAKRLKNLVSQIASLPSLPAIYQQLMTELNSADATIEKVGQIISQDMGMCAKILQMVNSAFFGFRQKITTPSRAVALLGFDTIKGLALSSNVFSQIENSRTKGFRVDALWNHSLQVASVARHFARLEKADRQVTDDCLIAGMMHDIGKLILVSELGSEYENVLKNVSKGTLPLIKAEREILGATHSEVGAYLLGLWGLPEYVLEGIAFHHHPNKGLPRDFSLQTAIHIADVIVNQTYTTGNIGFQESLDNAVYANISDVPKVDLWIQTGKEFAEKQVA